MRCQQAVGYCRPRFKRTFTATPDLKLAPFVHHTEAFYPNYVDALVQSVQRQPSYNGVLMVHRILNSKVDAGLRRRLLESLRMATTNPFASKHVREMASRFADRHT
jgi:hypothetical protein